jgi:uncharacterized Fe-S radical SAM superfamily protein PflX
MLNPKIILVEDKIKEQRLSKCKICEHYSKLTRQYKKCGCFVDFKTSLHGAHCSTGLW